MNENDKPIREEPMPGPEDQAPASPEGTETSATAPVEGPAETVSDTVEQGVQAAAEAAAEAEAAMEQVAEAKASAAEEATPAAGAAQQATGTGRESGAQSTTLMGRLAEDTEYDTSATSDDRLMAALSYASQLFFPISILVPVILLISETSKVRPFQKYHAVQSLAVGIVLWVLQGVLGVMASIAGATFILLLCLCFIVPVMIAIWLLPLYYAILAYNGKRFRIPGLTQFLEDQHWL